MDYVLDKIVKENNCTGDDGCSVTAADPGGSAAEYVIYLPNGTYNVNDTIVTATLFGSSDITPELNMGRLRQ
jgi:hypothetical protein